MNQRVLCSEGFKKKIQQSNKLPAVLRLALPDGFSSSHRNTYFGKRADVQCQQMVGVSQVALEWSGWSCSFTSHRVEVLQRANHDNFVGFAAVPALRLLHPVGALLLAGDGSLRYAGGIMPHLCVGMSLPQDRAVVQKHRASSPRFYQTEWHMC